MTRRRAVITGLGAVTPAGPDVPSTWASLVAGRCTVRVAPRLAAAGCRSRLAADVRDFDGGRAWYARQRGGRLARSVEFALAAAHEAWLDAALPTATLDPTRCGVILGTGFGDAAETFRESGQYAACGA